MISSQSVSIRGILLGVLWLFGALGANGTMAALADTVTRIKPGVVVVGTLNKLRSPPFVMRGTGFAVGDGTLIATNAHVLPVLAKAETQETLGVLIVGGAESQFREVRLVARDNEHDLAVLRLVGSPLMPLALHAAETVREGQEVALTGFPIGGVLGFSPVTHRGIISSITPIVLPGGNAQELSQKSIRRLRSGSFAIFQLDATAYPGNSGGPLFDPESGAVLGVINMVFVKETKESILEKPSGISYAIPASFLRELLSRVGRD